jgi:hypothetical protein
MTVGRYRLYDEPASTGVWTPQKLTSNNRNLTKKIEGFSTDASVYPKGTADKNFWEDVFSLAAYAVWVTDQFYNPSHDSQVGIVKLNGHNPNDVSPLMPKANGQVTLDLRSILPHRPDRNDLTLMGPDGLFGQDAEDLLFEIARTDKIFSKPIPAQARPLITRMLTGITSNKIASGKSARAANPNQVCRTQSGGYNPADLSGDAQITMGFPQTKPSAALGQTWGNYTKFAPVTKSMIAAGLVKPKVNVAGISKLMLGLGKGGFRPLDTTPKTQAATDETPKKETPKKETPKKETPKKEEDGSTKAAGGEDEPPKEEESNTLWWVLGISSGVLLLGGTYYVVSKNKKKKI